MKEPVRFSQALFDLICDHLADGRTLTSICKDQGMPASRTALDWAQLTPELGSQYARAREIGYKQMGDQILDIAHKVAEPGEDIRLQVDARKWLMSKALPKIYGDKTSIEAKVTHDWAAMCIEAVKPDEP